MLLTDRSPAEVLPAIRAVDADVKVQPLDPESLAHLPDLSPSVVVADGVPDPDRAHGLLSSLAAARVAVPTVVVLDPSDLDRPGWAEVADELVLPTATPAELRLRLAMVARRSEAGGDAVLRLGPLTVNVETYRVTVGGEVLDLTYKEFELLRFLVQRPGRVFTRTELLSEVWGYNFYGGTRTVDAHIRRLRAKLGPEHDHLIQTVRGVGYRAAGEGSPPGGGPGPAGTGGHRGPRRPGPEFTRN